jgi:RND family efflux transporter MFP subunit
MTRNEKSLLVIGLLLGVIIALLIPPANRYVRSLRQPASTPASITPEIPPPPAPEPASAIELSDDEQKSIGIETTEVKRQAISKEIMASGRVEEPETGIGAISARIGGRLERLLLDVTGERVQRGQAVAVIYSPEAFSSAEEYRLALENRQRLNASKESEAITNADELIRASRRRLELWGLTPEQIDQITTSPDAATRITIYSPVSGIVTKRNIAEGQYVREGDVLYTIADLGTVWIEADIFESDVPLIRQGIAATVSLPSTTTTYRGTISFLKPSVDPQTRTMTARIEVPNPQMRLRPGMFVNVSIRAMLGTNVLSVPRTAVLDTGKEKVVYVAKDNGVFEKRVIDAAVVGDENYAVTKGVEAGERVVTRGNFLIDSQTRLTGNITGMFGGSKAFTTETPGPKYTVSFKAAQSPPKAGTDNTFQATVTDPDGKPVNDAQVQATLVMPAMPSMGMAEMRSSFNLAWNGSEYAGPGTVAMAGGWNVVVEARRGGQLLGVYRGRFDAR